MYIVQHKRVVGIIINYVYLILSQPGLGSPKHTDSLSQANPIQHDIIAVMRLRQRSYFLIQRDGITYFNFNFDQNTSSFHPFSNRILQIVSNFYLQIFQLIYDTPSTRTFNVKLRINSARRNACKFIITTIIVYTPFNILSQVCITMQF